jgi:hypothetical protein
VRFEEAKEIGCLMYAWGLFGIWGRGKKRQNQEKRNKNRAERPVQVKQ